jgi:hypothetical protein
VIRVDNTVPTTVRTMPTIQSMSLFLTRRGAYAP